jgi:hypothetical protein
MEKRLFAPAASSSRPVYPRIRAMPQQNGRGDAPSAALSDRKDRLAAEQPPRIQELERFHADLGDSL